MKVYEKELPENLNESLESMLFQTYPPKELVLVCEGNLTSALNIIVKSFKSEFKDAFKIVQVEENVGLGAATNAGIEACRCPIIIKMDTDDISMPDRCIKQITRFAAHPKLDIVGTFIEEFYDENDEVLSIKKMPVEYDEIVDFARRRNPFNRQTIAFKRCMALEIGGYSNIEKCGDYEFIVRMLQNGARCENIPEPLVRYRITDQNLKYRKSWEYTKGFINVRKIIHKSGFSSFFDFIIPCMTQLLICMLPFAFAKFFYKKFLRN